MSLEIKEATESEVDLILDYWSMRNDQQLILMGVDFEKLRKIDIGSLILENLNIPYHLKKTYYLIFYLDEKPIGHTNVGKIIYGEEAFMHLHIWKPEYRQRGLGKEMVLKALQLFFDNLKLKRVLCEPNALNEAPNKTLQKVGFSLLDNYECIPGIVNFLQFVNRYEMKLEQYELISSSKID